MRSSTGNPQPWIDPNGRVASVTGAASGIGHATAIALASAGATVIATDTDLPGAQATAATIASKAG